MTTFDATTDAPPAPETAARELSGRVSSQCVIRLREPLAKRTTLRVGGAADLYVEPASEADLAIILAFALEKALPFMVLGRGSNLLVLDGGVRGVVVALVQPWFCAIEAEGHSLRCGAGCRLRAVANQARAVGISGLEFLEGIPGSLGGALRMNAGAMGQSIFATVARVRVMDRTGQVRESVPAEMQVAYRCCQSLKHQVALSAVLQGTPDQRDQIEQRMKRYSEKRWSTQPTAPSAGCIFKNPDGIPAGRLIDELGLKGSRIGGAVVSPKHGNFIVNDGNATARDVCALVQMIQDRARAARGIELETEVEIVGSDA